MLSVTNDSSRQIAGRRERLATSPRRKYRELTPQDINGAAVGSDISQAPGFADINAALEHYLPAVLCEVLNYWKDESLDGVFNELATVTAPRQVEIAGTCILISDQTLTPFHLQLHVASDVDEIEWLDCRLGEIRDGAMLRAPYSTGKGLRPIAHRLQSIEWRIPCRFRNCLLNITQNPLGSFNDTKHTAEEVVERHRTTNPLLVTDLSRKGG